MFQTDGPMVHLIHHELKSLVRGTMERFVKEAMIGASGKFSTKSLINVDLTKQENLLTLDKMDVGDGVRDILKKCKPSCRNENLKNMQAAFIAMALYFVENLPLTSQLLNDVMCLSPLLRKKSPPAHMCRIAKHIPHVISEDSISLLRGEWSLYQTDDEIQKSWFVENDGSYKRLDHYFAKVFELKTPSGSRRYEYMRNVVKTCCSLQNGNAAVERSLSDNKNTVTKDRSLLGDSTIRGLRRGKEFARSIGGAHMTSITPAMRAAVITAHERINIRKEKEKREKELKERKEMEAEEEKRRIKKTAGKC